METKTTVKVVRARVKRVLIYLKIEIATLSSLPRTLVTNFVPKGTLLCSYVPATDELTTTTVPTLKSKRSAIVKRACTPMVWWSNVCLKRGRLDLAPRPVTAHSLQLTIHAA